MENTEKKTVKKRHIVRNILLVLIVFFLFWNSVVSTYAHGLYVLLYPLPRLKCSITMTVDGEPYRLHYRDVSSMKYSDITRTKVPAAYVIPKKTGGTVGLWGLAYGQHPFEIRFQTKDMAEPGYFSVAPGICNWYSLAEFTADIRVDTESGTFSYDASRNMDGLSDIYSGSGEFSYTNDVGTENCVFMGGA